jgi:hypothetical protein
MPWYGVQRMLVEPMRAEGVENLRYGPGITAESVGEIAMTCRVVDLDGLLKLVIIASAARFFVGVSWASSPRPG